MANCAVATCKNYHRKTQKLDVSIVYHRFPKDPEMSKLWVAKCKRLDMFNCKNAFVCSEHFSSESYEDDIKNRLLGLPQKKILKSTAVPNLNLPNNMESDNISKLAVDRHERRNVRRIRTDALERLHTLSPKKARVQECPIASTSDEYNDNNCSRCDKYDQLLIENKLLKDTVEQLNSKLKELQSKQNVTLKKYKRKVTNNCKQLRKHIKGYKQIKRELCITKRKYNEQRSLLGRLQRIFTPAQIKSLTHEGQARWTSEDISRSVMLNALSRKMYIYLRERIGLPLPSQSTLSRWCKQFICFPGILSNVLALVKKCSENIPDSDKLCVLSFDEMHIDSRVEYCAALDQIVGPHSKVQVALMRGLCAKWKQPVFFDFDVTMDKDLLFLIINAIESAGIKVCAIVSDLGGCGTLWKQLQIFTKTTCFLNPFDSQRKIWVFADMPHYIKLLRNHFLDEGLVLGDGTEVTVNTLTDTLNKDTGEIKLCHKLDPSFLTLKGNDRQRVGPAKAVFSRTTAKAIKVLTGNEKVADFFELVDSFSDVMNSNSPYPPTSNPLRAGFGLEEFYEKQMNILQKMETTISAMRVKGKKSLLPFQKGILVSISSLIGLLEEVKNIHGLKYIMTTRLTQDVLENLFSQIRGVGHFYDHPSPTEVLSRLKTIMLANKMPKPSVKTNVENEECGHENAAYLTADILESAFEPGEVEEMISCTPDSEEALQMESVDEDGVEEKPWAEEEAISYIAGYVAFKVRKHDSTLGTMSKYIPHETLGTVSWIHTLSYAGLTVPSDSWKKTVNEFETVFESLHGNKHNNKKGIVKELKKRLTERFPNVCPQAIHVYSRIRTFIRIRHVNRGFVKKRSEMKKARKWMKSNKPAHS